MLNKILRPAHLTSINFALWGPGLAACGLPARNDVASSGAQSWRDSPEKMRPTFHRAWFFCVWVGVLCMCRTRRFYNFQENTQILRNILPSNKTAQENLVVWKSLVKLATLLYNTFPVFFCWSATKQTDTRWRRTGIHQTGIASLWNIPDIFSNNLIIKLAIYFFRVHLNTAQISDTGYKTCLWNVWRAQQTRDWVREVSWNLQVFSGCEASANVPRCSEVLSPAWWVGGPHVWCGKCVA